MRSRHVGAVFGIALVWALACRPAVGADRVASDHLLPPNVYAYVTIPSVPEVKTRWNQSLLGRLRSDPDLTAFWTDVDKQVGELSAEFEKRTGIALKSLVGIPTGEFAAAFVHSRAEGGAVIALLDVDKNHESLDKLLAAAGESLSKQGATKTTEKRADTDITVYNIPKPAGENADDQAAAAVPEKAQPADGAATDAKKGRTLAYFLKDSRFVAGSSIAILEQVLSRWNGGDEKNFATNEWYQRIIEQTKEGSTAPVALWYFNPVDLVTAAVQSLGQGNLQAQMAVGVLPILGLSELKAVGGGLHLATGGFDTVSRVFMCIDYPTSGVLNVFQFPAIAQAPPAWVPANASTYFGSNWDVAKAYLAVQTLFDSFQGPGAFKLMLDQMAEQEGSVLHVRKDLIDQITGRVHFMSDVPKTEAEDKDKLKAVDAANPEALAKVLSSERFLIALELKDVAKMKGLLNAISKKENFAGKTREVQGETIYEIETPPLPGVVGAEPRTMAFGVSKGYIMIASDATLLEQVLKSDPAQSTLADSAEYRKIAAHFPEKTSIIGFQQQDSQARTAYEMFRSGQAEQFIQGIDFTKLPPFEVMQKYLPATGSYFVPGEHGVLCVSFSLQKEK